MTFSFSKEFSVSANTEIENLFICEYLPISSGDAVKVYLYGLFLCQNNNFDKSITEFANDLKLSEEEVRDYFMYWEEFGLVNVINNDPFEVKYLPVRSSFSGKPRKYKAEKYTDFTKALQSLITSRMISTNEYTEYFSIMETFGIKPDAFIAIVKYCISLKGNEIGYKYISKVAKDFGARGINTLEKVDKELSAYNLRTSEIARILSAMNLKRQPEIEDLALYKKWTGELTFEPENIIFAASKIKKGSIEKLDGFLLELYSMKSFTKDEIAEYMNKKQEVYELAVKINRALSIYMDIIDTVVDTYTKKWLSYGFSGETLIYVANNCFKTGKNTLQYMDELVETLHSHGSIDLASVEDYFESNKKVDGFISKMLITAGVNRRPNDWDRQNVITWKSWNFSEEMILEAAKVASGKTSPIPYMNRVLSNWKRDGIFSLDKTESSAETQTDSQEEYNLEYARRRNLAVSVANRNLEKARESVEFSEIYARLTSIEKDLAFAEISSNAELLKSLEDEKAELNVKAEKILKTINLTLSDLSPKYACEKCNDTGYVGTHRCDCYNKKVQ